ncbi:MAG TPA: hypothetical protein PLS03_05095 [Terrimicrobiaceae bacterium]|nr:hypothetical protein [Terrimicrobiaceae bacterium]
MTEIPSVLEELLAPYPVEVQLRLREALARLRITNPDDPVLELMLALGLWGTFYQKISGQVLEAGRMADLQQTSALEFLDDRLRLLQGLAVIIQRATDRLSSAGDDIVNRFPVDDIVQKTTERIDEAIQSLPIDGLLRTVVTTREEMADLGRFAERAADKLETSAQTMEDCAMRLTGMGLSTVSLAGCVILGFALATFAFWWLGHGPF